METYVSHVDYKDDYVDARKRQSAKPWKCLRHSRPDEWLTPQRTSITTEVPMRVEQHGQFWGNFGQVSGILYSGFASTSARVTAGTPQAAIDMTEPYASLCQQCSNEAEIGDEWEPIEVINLDTGEVVWTAPDAQEQATDYLDKLTKARNVIEQVLPALESIANVLAFSARDWGQARDLAWLWGIVHGWDDGEDDEDSAMPEQARVHGWDEVEVARLRRLHAAFDAILEEAERGEGS